MNMDMAMGMYVRIQVYADVCCAGRCSAGVCVCVCVCIEARGWGGFLVPDSLLFDSVGVAAGRPETRHGVVSVCWR